MAPRSVRRARRLRARRRAARPSHPAGRGEEKEEEEEDEGSPKLDNGRGEGAGEKGNSCCESCLLCKRGLKSGAGVSPSVGYRVWGGSIRKRGRRSVVTRRAEPPGRRGLGGGSGLGVLGTLHSREDSPVRSMQTKSRCYFQYAQTGRPGSFRFLIFGFQGAATASTWRINPV